MCYVPRYGAAYASAHVVVGRTKYVPQWEIHENFHRRLDTCTYEGEKTIHWHTEMRSRGGVIRSSFSGRVRCAAGCVLLTLVVARMSRAYRVSCTGHQAWISGHWPVRTYAHSLSLQGEYRLDACPDIRIVFCAILCHFMLLMPSSPDTYRRGSARNPDWPSIQANRFILEQ